MLVCAGVSVGVWFMCGMCVKVCVNECVWGEGV